MFYVQLLNVMGILWDSLLELDELSASTNSVMELLSILVVVLSDETVASEAQSLIGSLNILVTRLWPFLSHNISSVRQSCVKTLLSLLTSEVKTTEKCMYNHSNKIIMFSYPDCSIKEFHVVLVSSL